jgi:succinate dehydrogenase / fumarate reductase cytochrome b subunit
MLRLVHSFVGLFPLGLFLPFHLWANWAALSGREAWVDRGRALGPAFQAVLGLAFGLCLIAHLWLWPRGAEPRPQALVGSLALRRLQQITGVAFLLFLGYHIYQVLPARLNPDLFGAGAYGVLWDGLGEPVTLGVYIVGISALYFHFAHGLCRAAVTWGIVSRPSSITALRCGAGLVGFALWAFSLQLVSHFAIGQGLIG